MMPPPQLQSDPIVIPVEVPAGANPDRIPLAAINADPVPPADGHAVPEPLVVDGPAPQVTALEPPADDGPAPKVVVPAQANVDISISAPVAPPIIIPA